MDAPVRTGFYATTVGKKVAMAATGFIMAGFLVVHVLGNFEIVGGRERLNAYAHLLHHGALPPLWAVRVVLLASVALHVLASAQLYLLKVRARPVPYRKKRNRGATLYALTMPWTGVALGAFIVGHILHFTTGTLHRDFVRDDVFHNVTRAFRLWWVSFLYVAAMVCLAMHLNHGLWSMTQSVGVSHPRYSAILKPLAVAVALLIAVGFTLIPVLVSLGAIG